MSIDHDCEESNIIEVCRKKVDLNQLNPRLAEVIKRRLGCQEIFLFGSGDRQGIEQQETKEGHAGNFNDHEQHSDYDAYDNYNNA